MPLDFLWVALSELRALGAEDPFVCVHSQGDSWRTTVGLFVRAERSEEARARALSTIRDALDAAGAATGMWPENTQFSERKGAPL